MNKKVRLTSLAKRDLAIILEYLYYKWSAKTANDFMDTFKHTLSIVASNPDYFPYFIKDKNLKKCVVTKHNTLYYREESQEIIVIRIYDVRQHPDKFKIS